MPFEPFGEAARLGGGKGFVKRGGLVGAEIILHQHDLRRVGEKRVGQILERMGIIDGRVVVGHLHMPPAFQRREQGSRSSPSSEKCFSRTARRARGASSSRKCCLHAVEKTSPD